MHNLRSVDCQIADRLEAISDSIFCCRYVTSPVRTAGAHVIESNILLADNKKKLKKTALATQNVMNNRTDMQTT